MAYDALKPIKQTDFNAGPNYTEPPWNLKEGELAESANVWWEGSLKTVPYASRFSATPTTGAIKQLVFFRRISGTAYLFGVDDVPKIYSYNASGVPVLVATKVSTDPYWSTAVFNNRLYAANSKVTLLGTNGVTVSNVAAPRMRYILAKQDYLFGVLANTTVQPSVMAYSDTDNAESWPVGNRLNFGQDDGDEITGAIEWGDVIFVTKNRSIWILSGTTPSDFKIEKSLSDVGCVAPRTLCWTDLGVFFWSENGPTLFNGFRSFNLTDRIKGLLKDSSAVSVINWARIDQATAKYYPRLRQVLVSYCETSQTVNNKTLIIDMNRVTDRVGRRIPYAIWPMTTGITAMAHGTDITLTGSRTELILGMANGHVLRWDNGTNFNGAQLAPRIRSGAYSIGPDKIEQVRTIDVWLKGNTNTVTIKYSTDGSTFTTHPQASAYANTGTNTIKLKRLHGDGSGNYITGRRLQVEVSAVGSTNPFGLFEIGVGMEPGGPRDAA